MNDYARGGGLTGPIWYNVHVQRPEDVPHHAVWKVLISVAAGMSHIYMEVHTDSHMSSSVYEWDHHSHASPATYYPYSRKRNYTHIYMTIDTGIIFFLGYTDRNKIPFPLMTLEFIRQPLYDERLEISNKIPKLDNYTFFSTR